MISKLLIGLGVLAALLAAGAFSITRDGSRVVPQGKGKVLTPSGEFEAFPLPDYVAAVLTGDYKSYLVEVEPGIKIHVLEVGEGYPVYMQHGNPTNGLLYRQIAEKLPTERLRIIMPTLVGLGFSSKVPASEHTIGAALLIINKSSPTAEGSLLGDVFILINAASYSVYLVLVKKLMKTYHPITVTLYAFIFGLLIVAPFGLDKFLQTNWSLLSPNLWFAAVFLVLGTTFLTYVLNAVSLKYVPSSVVSGYIYLQPFLGTLIAVLSGKYSLQAYQIIYGIFILLGVYLTTKRVKKVD